MKFYLGIDPGKDGAIACLEYADDVVKSVTFFDVPTIRAATSGKREYDEAAMAELIVDLVTGAADDGCQPLVTIEKQFAMPIAGPNSRCPRCKRIPQAGGTALFTTGYGYGLWIGMIASTMARFIVAHPVTWKKAMLTDAPKGKEASLMIAKRLFPMAADHLKRKKDHNRAEALLLAEYGRRRSLGR